MELKIMALQGIRNERDLPMRYGMNVFCVFTFILLAGCTILPFIGDPPFMGAKMLSIEGGDYVERWYLNPEYGRMDVPSGTAFYGAAADKVKDKFIVKYYVDDGKKSDVEIPRSDMWTVNHNGKSRLEQNDDNFFKYKKNAAGLYERFKVGNFYQIVVEGRLLAIRSCDEEGWCKVYPHIIYGSEDIYVRREILKEPLEQKPDGQSNE